MKFALEVVEAVSEAVGEERTALRLSPWGKDQGYHRVIFARFAGSPDHLHSDMGMKNPIPTYAYLISQLKEKHPDLSYLHFIQSREIDDPNQSNEVLFDLWSPRPLVVADGFDRDKALKIAERERVLVAFGRHFISNVSYSKIGNIVEY